MRIREVLFCLAVLSSLATVGRTLADPVKFNLDTAHSSLKVTGYVPGAFPGTTTPLQAQRTGSDTASYSGFIWANLSAGNIQFPGSSAVTANNFSGAALTPDATANYGMKANILFVGTVNATVVDLVFDTTSGDLAVAPNGTFPGNTGITATVTSGTIDYVGPPSIGSGNTSLAGSTGANQSATSATLALAGQTQTLTIPVHAEILFTVSTTNDSKAVFDGQFTAARTLVTPAIAYWQGNLDSNWSTMQVTAATNWKADPTGASDTLGLPGSVTDVFFTTGDHGSNLTTTLGANYSIKGLTFTMDATLPTSIGGTNTLTLGADGLAAQSGAAAMTMSCPVVVGASQPWNSDSLNPVTVSGSLAIGSNTLTKSGTGTVILSGAQTFGNSAAVHVAGGTLRYNAVVKAAAVGTAVNVTVADGAQLELAGAGSALYDGNRAANVTNDSQLPAGGLLVSGANQRVGSVSGGGTTVVSAGASLTANGIQQTLLAIGGAAGNQATLTIAASDTNGNPLLDVSSPSIQIAPVSVARTDPSQFATSLGFAELGTAGANELTPLAANAASVSAMVPEPTSLLLAVSAVTLLFKMVGGRLSRSRR